ncbi:hypothetical protein BUALT_Bualt12G0041700 [Buddleja alternifolia]|uniref:Disease resistance protein winged helix domain-containing protein n=1 Tax=Buddleja alternifolia TaxID=168488 RepID=A0AAV6WWL1_9LAMI|nr:hypothetical protein BUALT_Bualt12G0041700 [Buddleja alternifolia]
MHALKCVDDEFYGDGNGVKFPSLEILEVCQMAELVDWKCSNGSIYMPCLTTLRIEDCPKLQSYGDHSEQHSCNGRGLDWTVLSPWSDNDCWNLIKQIAFFRKENKENLESLGQEIAKKCKSLPLAAKTLGRVLHCKSSEDEWHSILKSELWDLPQDRNSVYPSLMLSYLYLPPHLKKCFAYCSIFPQNHEFELEELVLLWMEEGFIQPGGERRMEDIGDDYFNDLHSRCCFTQGKNSSNKIIYKMHDLIHDLARLVSTDTCFQMKTNHYPLFGNACHLDLPHNNLQPLELKASYKNERLRTFLVMCKNGVSGGLINQELFFNLKFARVLDLSNIGLGEVPDSINHLIYLQ